MNGISSNPWHVNPYTILGCCFAFANIPAALVGYASAAYAFRYFGIAENPVFSFPRYSSLGLGAVVVALLCCVPLITPKLEFFQMKYAKLVYAVAIAPLLYLYANDMVVASRVSIGLVYLLAYAVGLFGMYFSTKMSRMQRASVILATLLLFSGMYAVGRSHVRNAFSIIDYRGEDYAIIHVIDEHIYLAQCSVSDEIGGLELIVYRDANVYIDSYDEIRLSERQYYTFAKVSVEDGK